MPINPLCTYRVLNPDLKQVIPNKSIVAGFPGVGKSYMAKRHPIGCIDMESSDYHWTTDESGNKICHPEWPHNYVEAILKICDDPNIKGTVVYTSTHAEVLAEFDKRNLYYTAVVPRTKSIYLQRYIDRGNTPEFIEKLDKNFESFVESVKSTKVFAVYETDGFISDIFGSMSVMYKLDTVCSDIYIGHGFTITVYPSRVPKVYPNESILVCNTLDTIAYDGYTKAYAEHGCNYMLPICTIRHRDGMSVEDFVKSIMSCHTTNFRYVAIEYDEEVVNYLHENDIMFTGVFSYTKYDKKTSEHLITCANQVISTYMPLNELLRINPSAIDQAMHNIIVQLYERLNYSLRINKLDNSFDVYEDVETVGNAKKVPAATKYGEMGNSMSSEDDADCFCE